MSNFTPEHIRDKLLENVDFEPFVDPDALQWNPESGFLEDQSIVDVNQKPIVGFAVPNLPGDRVPTFNSAEWVHSVTTYDALPRSMKGRWKGVDHGGKGLGLRLCTDPVTAFRGSDVANPVGMVGLYGLNVPHGGILDRRPLQEQAGRRGQIVRQLGLHVTGLLLGGEKAINRVHNELARLHGGKDPDAVQMLVPPKGELDTHRSGLRVPEGIRPGFMIVRNPHAVLRLLGRVTTVG